MRLVFGSILVVVGVIAVTILTRVLAKGDQEKRLALGVGGLRLVAMALIPLGALMILSSGIRMISAGQVGVALLFGKVQPVVLHEGINLVNPLYDVVEMNTRVLRHQAKYDAASKDLQAVHVEMVLNYRLLPGQGGRGLPANRSELRERHHRPGRPGGPEGEHRLARGHGDPPPAAARSRPTSRGNSRPGSPSTASR